MAKLTSLEITRRVKALPEAGEFRVGTNSERVLANSAARFLRQGGAIEFDIETEQSGTGFIIRVKQPKK